MNSQTKGLSSFYIGYVLVCFAVSSVLYVLVVPSSFGDLGTNDFVQYWAASKLMVANANPYDAAAMFEIQQTVGFDEETPMMNWTPPWTIALMSPLLDGSFWESARLWFVASVVLYCWTIFFCLEVLAVKDRVYYLLWALLFFPLWVSLDVGQVSSLLGFSLAGLWWSLDKEKDYLTGLFLALLSVKGHIFYLLVLAVAWWVVRNRRFKVVISGFVCLGGLILLSFLYSPSALALWWKTIGSTPTGGFGVRNWLVATGPGFAEAMLAKHFGISTTLIRTIVPLVSSVCFMLWMVLKSPRIEWKTYAPPLLAWSVFLAPYGWPFDFLVLLPLQLGIVWVVKREGSSGLVLLALASVNLFAVLYFKLLGTYFHELFWYPMALIFLMIWAKRSGTPVREV